MDDPGEESSSSLARCKGRRVEVPLEGALYSFGPFLMDVMDGDP